LNTSPDVVISVEGLWKQYRYGVLSHRALYKDVQSWWARFRGQEDPNVPIGKSSPITRHPSPASDDADHFWALQDINFEVKQGEVLGIIGKNGAGKSTLLKIMSRVTTPTKGQVKIKGRIASLLEVGTGFHPELTGRENIFLNGAILGMTKAEIKKKFDEIVAFAELEKFIDTPVKRYSSGMYVRLAFAVAAHLEPEILIIDEVLAVGDAQFQKKCLGKMGDVAKEGRTVLFVSHNMNAIQTLCSKCVLLERGQIRAIGAPSNIVDKYIAQNQDGTGYIHADMKRLNLLSSSAEYKLEEDNQCFIRGALEFQAVADIHDLYIDFGLENQKGIRILQIIPEMKGDAPILIRAGQTFIYKVEMTSTELAPGDYCCTIYAHSRSLGVQLYQSEIRLFSVVAHELRRECMATGFTAVLLPKYRTEIRIKGT
jgi:lipopolysaccharide transport system ATP-binding protein